VVAARALQRRSMRNGGDVGGAAERAGDVRLARRQRMPINHHVVADRSRRPGSRVGRSEGDSTFRLGRRGHQPIAHGRPKAVLTARADDFVTVRESGVADLPHRLAPRAACLPRHRHAATQRARLHDPVHRLAPMAANDAPARRQVDRAQLVPLVTVGTAGVDLTAAPKGRRCVRPVQQRGLTVRRGEPEQHHLSRLGLRREHEGRRHRSRWRGNGRSARASLEGEVTPAALHPRFRTRQLVCRPVPRVLAPRAVKLTGDLELRRSPAVRGRQRAPRTMRRPLRGRRRIVDRHHLNALGAPQPHSESVADRSRSDRCAASSTVTTSRH
jgi:hypothetical protein